MTRFARDVPVVFWEEPTVGSPQALPELQVTAGAKGVVVVTPILPPGLDDAGTNAALRALLEGYLGGIEGDLALWYYTPMMLPFTRHLEAACVVYDCMDELANFRFAPPQLADLERELFRRADLVFTGGYSLYEAKREHHPAVHPFPSSVDYEHFARARKHVADPADQADLPLPRLGYFGVVDERVDLDLLAQLADAHPEWSLVVVGPVVKIDPANLPQRPNIAYLGAKAYEELPQYAGGWQVALMPFAINDATRFISPTKTPEYLAAGLPVVSTPIADVVRHYGDCRAVAIAPAGPEFVAACERALSPDPDPRGREDAEAILAKTSWDAVTEGMFGLIRGVARQRDVVTPISRVGARRKPHYDYLVVGAGFAGAVMAERLAAGAGKRVLVIDRRPHLSGNAYDHRDAAGILVHRYGPHIFHTNSREVFAYLSRFTKWRPYAHRVLAQVGDRLLPMPINRTTLNRFYGLSLSTEAEAEAFLAAQAEPIAAVRSSADVVLAKVGRELYETFFQGYSRKQWGIDPSELDPSVTARVPVRFNEDDRYFTDTYQAMPAEGFTRMFKAMLDHPNIEIGLGEAYADACRRVSFDRLVFTGPIDEFFDHRFGRLPYRSLAFRHVTEPRAWHQPVAVVNYPDAAVPYTRVTEYKHLTGQVSARTSLTYEYPSDAGDPYYPVPRPENHALYKRYEALALARPDVLFVGRLATYRYYNMDQVVGQALATYRRHVALLGARAAAE